MPAMWYLMNEGKRRPVMEQVPGMPVEELDQALLQWVDSEVYGAAPRRAVIASRHNAKGARLAACPDRIR